METILGWFKAIVALLPYPYLLMMAAVIIFGGALFIPAPWQQTLGFYDVAHAHRALEWFVFASCLVILTLKGTHWTGTTVRQTQRFRYRLNNLSESEQEMMDRLSNGKENSVIGWPHQPGIVTLWAEKIIEERPTALNNGMVAYVLSPKARKIYAKLKR